MSNIEIVDFKPMKKGSLVAVMTIFIPSVGFEIRNVTAWNKDGRRWFSFPSQKFETENGETAYNAYIKIPDKNYFVAFQKAMSKTFDEYVSEKFTESKSIKPRDIDGTH